MLNKKRKDDTYSEYSSLPNNHDARERTEVVLSSVAKFLYTMFFCTFLCFYLDSVNNRKNPKKDV